MNKHETTDETYEVLALEPAIVPRVAYTLPLTTS